MYPVLSVLRRAAVSYIYVRPELLEPQAGALHVRLETATNYLLPDQGKWSPAPSELVPIAELVVEAASSEAAAISMAKKENDLAEALRAEEMVYTLVLGPEQEDLVDGKVVRRSRYAVIRGVYRAHGKVGLQPVPAKETRKAFYGRSRQPTVRLD